MRWLPALLAVLLASCQSVPRGRVQAADHLLDRFHDAASRAAGEEYFSMFDDDATFIGTDPTERWSVEQFRAYAEPWFAQGKGWTYRKLARHISLDGDGNCAWFDEVLDNDSYGAVRGSGVLVWKAGRWRVAQYVLSFAVPNGPAEELVARIRAGP